MQNVKQFTLGFLIFHFLFMFQTVGQSDTITRQVTYRDSIALAETGTIVDWKGDLPSELSPFRAHFEVQIETPRIETEIHALAILDRETNEPRVEPRWVRNDLCDQFVGVFSTRGGVRIGGWLVFDLTPFFDGVYYKLDLGVLNPLLPVKFPENIDRLWDEAEYFVSLPDGEDEIILRPEFPDLMPEIDLSGADIADLVLAAITAGTTKAADAALVAANTVLDEEDRKQKGAVRTLIETILANAGFKLNGGLGCELKLSDVGLGIERSTVKDDKVSVRTRCDGTLSAQFYLTFSADFFAQVNPLGVKLWEKKAKIADQQFDVGPQFKFDSLDFIAAPNPIEFPTKIAADDFTRWDLPGGAAARLGKGATFDMDYSPTGDLIAVGTSTGAWLYDAESGEEVALLRSGGNWSTVTTVRFSPNGKTLATGGRVVFWDVATRTQKPRIGNIIHEVKSFNPDGTLVATMADGHIYVWDVASGTEKYRVGSNVRNVYDSASFSPNLDSPMLAVIDDWQNRVGLWDVSTGEHIAYLPEDANLITSTSFSPDGKTLAGGAVDGKIYLWDVGERTVGKVLIVHTNDEGRNDDVFSVSFSPDGETLASGGRDGTVRLWNVDSGEQIAIFTGHIGYVSRVSFGRDSKTLASFSHEDGSVYVWDLATGIPKFTISGYGRLRGTQLDEPQDVIFSPDGKTLASIGSDDGAIYLWDVATGRERASLNGCLVVGEDIRSMNFSPDGKTLASGGSDDMVRLWDVASGREIAVLKSPPPVQRVIFSPDGKTLAIHAGDNVHLWDVEARAEIVALTGHTGWVDSVSFSPDRGSKILAGINYDGDYSVRLWDIDTRAEIGALGGDYQSLRSVVFSPDGETLAAINSVGGMVHLWNVQARREIAVLPHARVQSVSFSPDKDSKIIATGGIDGLVRLWDVPTGTHIGEALAGHDNRVRSVTFSPDGKVLATVAGVHYREHRLILWDVEARREIAVFTHLNHPSISFSPDSRTLASTGYDYDSVYLWDVPTGRKKNLVTTRHTEGLLYGASVSFSPDSKTLASADGNDVRLWDVGTRTLIGEALTGHTQTVRSVSFNPDKDSKTLVSSGGDRTVRLWDVETRVQIAELPHTQIVRSLSLSPDGKTLATIDDRIYVGEVRLWDVEARTEIAVLPHAGVQNVSFSPDRGSRMIASGGADGKVRLWDIDTDTEIAVLQGPADFFARVSFSPDGKTLAASGAETTNEVYYGVVYLWDVDTLEEIAVIRMRVTGSAILGFSPDSRMLAFAEHGSSTVRLWDVEAGEEKPGFATGFNPVDSMSFSPDGKTLATVYGGVVRLWDVATRIPRVTIREPEIRHSVPIFSPDGRTLVVFSVSRLFWLNVPASGAAAEGTRLAADVNGDGAVNIQDLVAVSAALGQTGENDADINGDGAVNIQDMVAAAAALLDAAAAPALIDAQPAAGLTAAEVAQWIAAAQSANLTDATSQRGIRYLHYLLAMLTPTETALLANYPNPFNPETWMPYRLAAPGDVTLTIRAVDGGMVRSLALGHQPAGVYEAKSRAAYWDGRNSYGEAVASGVYFYTLSAGDFSATRKMLIRK